MNLDDLNNILGQAVDRTLPDGASRPAIERVERAILGDLAAVRPLASLRVFTLAFVVLFVAIGTTSASILSLHGLHVLSNIQRTSIFLMLLTVAWAASASCAREMRPTGSRFSSLLLFFAAAVFPALFSLIFHDYSTRNFVPEGIPCLVAGLCISIPTALVVVYIMRRGFAMDWSMAGVAAGTLSGLTGLAMLELHCPNLKAIHVMVWHVAVVLASGILGFTTGRVADHFRRIAV